MPSARARATPKYIAANVGRLRQRRGWTQERMAEAAGLDLRYLQRVERGGVNPSVVVLVSLAEALRISPGVLLRPAELLPAKRGRPVTKRVRARQARRAK